MSFALLRKELREHGIVLVIALLLSGLVLIGLFMQAAQGMGGRFVGLTRFSYMIGPLLVLVFANRLLVREYGGRTQLFLETLPIGRARVFATKWLLGCALTLAVAAIAWWAALSGIRRTEVLATDAALGVLYCILLFWGTLWAFAAFGGMLGRYRYVLWGAVLVLVYLTINIAGIPLFDMPVMRLLGTDVQQASGLPERNAFAAAGAVALVCLIGSALLALYGAGAMASALAKRMTARERVFVLVSFMAVMTAAFMLEPKPVQPPFEITDGVRVAGRTVEVGVLPTSDLRPPAARELAATLANDVDELAAAIGYTDETRVFVQPQQGLDRHTVERAFMINASGVVLKMAPNAPRDLIRTLVAHSVLGDATLDRGMREDRHVFFDGFSALWAVRDDTAAQDLWTLRAAAVAEPLTVHDLKAWAHTSERFGECVSLAIGYNVVAALEQELGKERNLELIAAMFSRPHDDARVLFERSPGEVLRDFGTDWERVASSAEARRAEAQRRFAVELAARPRVHADVVARRDLELGTLIETTLEGVDRHYVYYSPLGPWTADVGGLPRLDVRGAHATLPISPPRGSRIVVMIEYEDPVLDCPARALAKRLELP